MTTEGAEHFSDIQRREIIDALVRIARADRLSNRFLARSVLQGSAPTWTLIRQGKYAGNTDKYLRRAQRWLADRVSRAQAPAASYVQTSIGEAVQKVCHRAWEMPCMARIVTPSGAGKTAALLEYVRRNPDRRHYLQAGQALSSPRGLLAELADKLGADYAMSQTTPEQYRRIRKRLAELYAGGTGDPVIVVVDEATTLTPPALNILRNLHDDPACRLAVVLADTWRLDAELRRPAGMAGGYEQLRSRFGATLAMSAQEEISRADVAAVAGGVLAAVGFDGRLHADAARYLHRLAQGDGKLRNVVHRIQAVHAVAEDLQIEPEYSVAQLDYVADLVGAEREMRHTVCPFGQAGERQQPAGNRQQVA